MIRKIRIRAKKVNFGNIKIKRPVLERDIINEKISRKKDRFLSRIQEEELKDKNQLNNIHLDDLKKEDIERVLREPNGLMIELLEYYLDSKEKEKKLSTEIERLREKPWAGKGSIEIIRENEELKRKNRELMVNINKVLKENEEIS